MFGKVFGKVVKRLDKTGDIIAGLQSIDAQRVLAGIPQKEINRKEEGPNNAELAYIHSKGSPMNNIPARPFMEPSIEANRDAIARIQAGIIKDALSGKTNVADAGFNRLGLYVSTEAKRWFTNPANNWAPNSPITIARKGSDKPLIDTGALRQAITYVVDTKR
jgi:hypothetical protein